MAWIARSVVTGDRLDVAGGSILAHELGEPGELQGVAGETANSGISRSVLSGVKEFARERVCRRSRW
jgi:hypothetical protein